MRVEDYPAPLLETQGGYLGQGCSNSRNDAAFDQQSL